MGKYYLLLSPTVGSSPMSETIIADFVANVVPPGSTPRDAVRCRVLLSPKRLVVARSDDRHTVPLSCIFDIGVGQVPPEAREFFDHTVTIAYRDNDSQRSTVIEADAESINRFITVLFRAIINGEQAQVVHPARVGGRVTEQSVRNVTVKLQEQAVLFNEDRSQFTIDLPKVTRFEKQDRTLGSRKRPVILVKHVPDSRSVTSLISMSTQRMMNILGRYLRLEYSTLVATLEEIELSEDELEVLVALYSGGEDLNVARFLGADSAQADGILRGLEEKGLLIDDNGRRRLSPQGYMASLERIETVNA